MAWEKFEKNFPYGIETNFGFTTADALRQHPEIGVATISLATPARNMTIKEDLLIYGKDNELAIAREYDIDNEILHPDTIFPLNVYGTAMLRDYLAYNYIPSDEF